ncbi:MAG: hypothetical protein QOH21_1887 [Acidobacteriota bacterium]|nr:hypothetical protein [Acidobacteriota bacterium]
MGRQHVAAGILFLLLTLTLTWPLARNLDRAVADPGDPYINTWILDWDWWATFHQPLALYQANAFHPAQDSLAFSENLYGVAVLLFPLRAVGVGPVAAYNVAMLLGFAFSGFAAYLLGRRLTASWIAGMAAGVFYAFVPFRFVHLSHVQHVWGGWLPLLLLALLAYVDEPDRKRAALFAAVFVMNGLTNIHYFFFGSLAVALTFALLRATSSSEFLGFLGVPRGQSAEAEELRGTPRHPRNWFPGPLAIATALALLVLAPFLYPYAVVAKLYGMQRSYEEVLRFSAIPSDWLRTGEQSAVYSWLADGHTDPERWLFPGALVLVLAAIGLFYATRRERAIALLWIVLGFAGSLGLHFELHRFLFGGVPGFRAIRSPARWAVITYVGLAILTAFATAALARRARWAALLVPLLFALELRPAHMRWWMMDPKPPEVYTWLAAQPRGTAVMELPIDAGTTEYGYMYRATAHHQPIVNGVSGFAPPERVALSVMANAKPIPDDFVDRLRADGVQYVIVHADQMAERTAPFQAWLQREIPRGRVAFVRRFDGGVFGDWVFRISSSRAERGMNFVPEIAKAAYNRRTFGHLDSPSYGFVYRGDAVLSGYALSPYGIARVDFLLDNRSVRVPAKLIEDVTITRLFPWYPVPHPRFAAWFNRRPDGVPRKTDVVVEITDGRGEVTALPSGWFTWN